MSIRPVKRLAKSKPTLEGAGVTCAALSVSGRRQTSTHSYCWTIFGMTYLMTIWLASHGIPIAASRR